MYLQYHSVAPSALHVHESEDLDFLDEVYDQLLIRNVEGALDTLKEELYNLYVSTTTKEWDALVNNVLLKHPIHKLLMQDPLTRRSFSKPRGYSGDAALLDMIYFPWTQHLDEASPLGKQINKYTVRTQVCKSLTERMKRVAAIIDKVSLEKRQPRVLSIASGHCREAQISSAAINHELGKYVALDSDEKSIAVLDQTKDAFGITPVHASIVDLIKGKYDLGKFDLIYSSGLYDYLSTNIAKRLTGVLYKMLDPDGQLILFNIEPDYKEIGYIESYMNWEMIGRNEEDLLDLLSEIDGSEIATVNVQNRGKYNSHFNSIEIQKS